MRKKRADHRRPCDERCGYEGDRQPDGALEPVHERSQQLFFHPFHRLPSSMSLQKRLIPISSTTALNAASTYTRYTSIFEMNLKASGRKGWSESSAYSATETSQVVENNAEKNRRRCNQVPDQCDD